MMEKRRKLSTITDIHSKLINGELRIDDLISDLKTNLDDFNSKINAFITLIEPVSEIFDPDLPLSCIPIAIKDLVDLIGTPTTAGAEFNRNNYPSDNSTVTNKIINSGGIIMGKTNLHEIALGVTNINPHYGVCRNPWNPLHISGGSSGGSAAAVASGICVAALGTDTGGSIRIPSSLCGTVGLKPTYGRVSLKGVIPLSWNLDHVGPITNCVKDSAIMLQVIAGYDDSDPSSVDIPVDDYLSHIDEGIKGLRIVFAVGEYIEGTDPQILNAVQRTADAFRSLGADVSFMNIPWLRDAALANGIMTTADAAAVYIERIESTPGEFGQDVLKRLLTGKSYTSTQYSRARRVQVEVQREFKRFFQDFDLIVLPTTPIAAPLIEGVDSVEQAGRLTRFTAPFNLAGLPAISIPCGFTSNNLPIGVQLVGDHWKEATILRAANAFEKSTKWMINKSIPI